MALSMDFGITVAPGRLDAKQIQALDVTARLVMWIVGRADAERGTFYVTMGEFAAWAACSHRQAARAMDTLEATGWVTDVARREHGNSGRLGGMFKLKGDPDVTMPARLYTKVFELRAHFEDRKRMGDEVGSQLQDLKLWSGVCGEWRKAGHNPADIIGLLDCFNRKRARVRAVANAPVSGWINNKQDYGDDGHGGGDERSK